MKQPSPAIVGQAAVRRLPRLPLLLLCLAYVLPGFWAREPWKSADLRAFGYMWELAQGHSGWLQPVLAGSLPAQDGLLPYWLGAFSILVSGTLGLPWSADSAARLPFALLALLALTASWYAVYCLARYRQAQPVAFAFGGEARPADYARAVADGGVLAMLACLGLAQLTHEATPALAQLAFEAAAFCGAACLHRRPGLATLALLAGLVGLSVSGAPSLALMLGLGTAVITGRTDPSGLFPTRHAPSTGFAAVQGPARVLPGAAMLSLACTLVAALLATALDAWTWRLQPPPTEWLALKGLGRLLLWFTWPAWPLTLWTMWRWRTYWRSPHMALPMLFIAVPLLATVFTDSADRSLLLALPAFAALAAFALPTLSRSLSALIDWFTLLFFSACSLFIWVYWLAMQTGVPKQFAANVARLAPGFVPTLSWLATTVAVLASVAWVGLVRWRVGRHRAAIWKSLVLPASGATLAWLLLMTLWLPLLDYARSSLALAQTVRQATGTGCVAVVSDNASLIAALRYHADMQLELYAPPPVNQTLVAPASRCAWLLVEASTTTATAPWVWHSELQSPNRADRVQLYRQQP